MSGAPPSTYGRPSVAYVTPSRRATRTALSNSSSARACHLDVATLRRFSHLPRQTNPQPTNIDKSACMDGAHWHVTVWHVAALLHKD